MSVQGYTQKAIVAAYSRSVSVEYTYVAAITIVIYDSLLLFHRELEYVYTGRQTVIKWIYILIKLSGIIIFGLNFVAFMIPPQTPTHLHEFRKKSVDVEGLTRCFVRQWVAGFFFEIVYSVIIKTLLVLRLRALYGNKKSVTAMLCLATAVELIGTAYAFMFTGLNMQRSIAIPAPIPGCTLRRGRHTQLYRSLTIVWITRLMSNGFELILLLYGLYQSLKEAGSYSRSGWARVRRVAPILYVFYRDGTIFYIPVCALSIFGLIATVMQLGRRFTCANWEAWLGITYYIVGTRLILNIRQAGFNISTSMLTGPQLSSLPFYLDGELTSTDGGAVTSGTSGTTSTVENSIDTKGRSGDG
ncbi:hypothetical protein Agabi119p4_7600 [Agaricus bisporus var. burnettii]|uniref:DUF6533 domain-containing protein n=1 Tax=Agaricus bisporus var. burnettii TaxID=192524 RepID=A0A8H7C7D7_AGABI|nr:hypothetical protein Agabi119p4_7600 [Agaricus bisporus var. burnettii]